MDISQIEKLSETAWRIPAVEPMRVPAVIYGGESLVRDMDEKVAEQLRNVAALPRIVRAAYAMPDAHWGYGFPVGGVAAFDADEGGVVSAGGVGFDVSCGVRTHLTGLTRDKIASVQPRLADALYREIPAGLGSHSAMTLDDDEMTSMLSGGARGASSAGLDAARTWSGSRNMAALQVATQRPFPITPANAKGGKWGRSDRAITISKFRKSPRFSMRKQPKH